MPAIKIPLDEVVSELAEFIGKELLEGDSPCSVDCELSSLGLDSFSLIELLLHIEKTYSIRVSAAVLRPAYLSSLNALAEFLVSYSKGIEESTETN